VKNDTAQSKSRARKYNPANSMSNLEQQTQAGQARMSAREIRNWRHKIEAVSSLNGEGIISSSNFSFHIPITSSRFNLIIFEIERRP